MFRTIIIALFAASSFAFVPSTRFVQRSSLSMGIESFIGASAPAEGGFFDPFKLSAGKSDETLAWYRAAELKHGRVSMLATLGIFIQGLKTGIIPNPSFTETDPIAAVAKVYAENPGALIQIGLAIAAVEVLGASIESKTRPGDYGWDPANIRPKTAELLDEMQTKELKNGRLAMVSLLGMFAELGTSGKLSFAASSI
eukprot:gene9895-13309_t